MDLEGTNPNTQSPKQVQVSAGLWPHSDFLFIRAQYFPFDKYTTLDTLLKLKKMSLLRDISKINFYLFMRNLYHVDYWGNVNCYMPSHLPQVFLVKGKEIEERNKCVHTTGNSEMNGNSRYSWSNSEFLLLFSEISIEETCRVIISAPSWKDRCSV